MRRLLLGSNNDEKILEYCALFADLPLLLTSPRHLGLVLDVDEIGQTFKDNAVLKARVFARETGLLALADDSGLEVDALDGLPGIHSRRYAGPDATDADRIALLLERLRGVPKVQRSARFRCVIAVAAPDGALIATVDGVVQGHIATQPRGSFGFGYDPVFWLPEQNCTMAQLDQDEKNKISHRALAALAIRDQLSEWASQG